MIFDSRNLIVTEIDSVVPVSGAGEPGQLTRVSGPRRFHGLILQISGRSRYVVEDRLTLTLGAGGVLYLPRGKPYRVYSDGAEPRLCQCVNFQLLEDPGLDGFAFRPARLTPWQDIFGQLLAAWTAGRPGGAARCRSLLYALLAMTEEHLTEQYVPTARLDAVRRAGAYLEERLADPTLSVEDAAAQIGMSPAYFREQFRAVYRVPPKRYLLALRMARAKSLLASTGLPVAGVAAASGFESVYHFSKAFRRAVGVSPSAYRGEMFEP